MRFWSETVLIFKFFPHSVDGDRCFSSSDYNLETKLNRMWHFNGALPATLCIVIYRTADFIILSIVGAWAIVSEGSCTVSTCRTSGQTTCWTIPKTTTSPFSRVEQPGTCIRLETSLSELSSPKYFLVIKFYANIWWKILRPRKIFCLLNVLTYFY